MKPIDTSEYIKSARLYPAPELTASDRKSYPEDPTLTLEQHNELLKRNELRTILVTGNWQPDRSPAESYPVVLNNVTVHRGKFPAMGSGGPSSAISIIGATSISMDDVEVTGAGRGYGIRIHSSKDVTLSRIYIHDIIWSLVRGDRAVTLADLKNKWVWNRLPVYEYDSSLRKFVVVRAQETASGIVISQSKNIEISDSTISNIGFRVEGNLYPWQADGITLSAARNVAIRRTTVSSVWEGIDVSGGDTPELGVSDFLIENVKVRDTLAYGIKIVHAANRGRVNASEVVSSGLTGIPIAGPINDIVVTNTNVIDTGVFRLNDGTLMYNPWNMPFFAGVMVGSDNELDPLKSPQHVRLAFVNISNPSLPGTLTYQVLGRIPNLNHVALGRFASPDNTDPSKLGVRNINLMPYSVVAVAQAYRTILGCEAPMDVLIGLWDQGHSSVRNPAWSMTDVQAELLRLKSARAFSCRM